MINNNINIYVIIPLYNEEKNVAALFSGLRDIESLLSKDYNLHFVLVDDGSFDATNCLVNQWSDKKNNIKLITHSSNQGPGRAFASAFAYLSNFIRNHDWIVTMEGDNTSKFELLCQMLVRTKEGYDVVLASPYMYGGGIYNTNPLRIILSKIANTFVNNFLGISGFLTVSSFFRLYNGCVLRKLQKIYGPGILEQPGFECMIELLLKMVYLKISISEISMVLDTNLRKGKSKMKILFTIYGYFVLFFKKNKWKKKADNYIRD